MRNVVEKVVGATLMGTTAMTAYSYLLTRLQKEDFREPVQINRLLFTDPLARWRNSGRVSGVLLHYLAGVGFAIPYVTVVERLPMTNLVKLPAYGLLAGLAGVLVWETSDRLLPGKIKEEKPRFYGHLLGAHVVFTLGAALGTRLVKRLYRTTPTAAPTLKAKSQQHEERAQQTGRLPVAKSGTSVDL